jgi:hypothetical protein
MAITSICGTLKAGLDLSCVAPTRRYYQQAVIINKADIETITVNPPTAETCAYTVEFSLKDGKTGYRILGGANGSTFKGMFAKSVNDTTGIVEYIHTAQLLIAGVDAATKCVLDALDKGSYVVALQIGNTVEIFGIQNGLTTGDYTYDVQEGGGGAAIPLQSREDAPEGYLPLVYESAVPGSEVADFDDMFANTGS